MPDSSNLMKRLYLAFGVLIAILLLLVAGAFRSFTQLADANRWNVHSYQVLAETHGISESLINVEAGARGYAVTGDRSFLPRLTKGRADLLRHFKAAQTLTTDNPEQQKHLRRLQAQQQRWMSGYVEPMLGTRRSSLDPASTMRAIMRISLRGKADMDVMAQTLADVDNIESDLLKKRSQMSDRLQSWTSTLLLAGSLFAIALSVALCVLLTGNTRRLTQTNAELAEEITERKQAEEELQATARKLAEASYTNQQIMDYSLDVICTIDAAGRFMQVSPASVKTWGYKPEELTGREFIELLHPDDVALTTQTAADIRSGTPTNNFENRYIHKNGVTVPMVWSAVWSASDQITFCVARDNTERKQAEVAIRSAISEAEQAKEEAERANLAKSEFLSRTSHELRTPLNAILGFGQLLEMDDLDDEHRAGVEQILKGGRHLLELVNEVLDIASIDAGRMALSSEPVQLADLAQETMELLQPLADERGIRFENNIGEGYVLADQQRLKQVLLNLLSNAVKYNRDGGLVRLASGTAAIPGRVRFEVTDSGPGISPSGLERLFSPFERLDASEKGVEGTGIGLTISQRLVRLMDGEIGVYSVEGEGSTFWVELPGAQSPMQNMERRTPLQSEAEKTAAETATQSNAAYTVLYIEDNLSNLNLIEHILSRRADVRLLSAMQGRRGLELAREHRPNLVLLDLHLPDIPGDEVLQHLRAETETRDIPVVMLSADATQRQIERLKAAGADEYLTKPLNVKQFMETLDETLKIKG
jgi:PAS domain S-box-containing protein